MKKPEHTEEYYQHQIKMLRQEVESWRSFARELVAKNGENSAIELLRADRDRWKTIAESRANAMLLGYKTAAVEEN